MTTIDLTVHPERLEHSLQRVRERGHQSTMLVRRSLAKRQLQDYATEARRRARYRCVLVLLRKASGVPEGDCV